ncbi:hypothetical protein [Mesorhizobium sp. M7A.F.Ca.US.008.03.1.1]|uniref:hypothetical protein n=1 Tax=Mesorhizobium sp. M7A.F.Ca.US.008.03.1.1 TaxID=2496742 RepID=UPI0013DFD1EA|nr:hypothetical protein [Mesorhizobium sp. M7A.F.Ca.US.008.03.1.1]
MSRIEAAADAARHREDAQDISGYSALCGHGAPAASPQRDAVGCGRKLVSSDWRTSSAKSNAKLPSIRKTMIRRVTGNMSASTG